MLKEVNRKTDMTEILLRGGGKVLSTTTLDSEETEPRLVVVLAELSR